ncbi:metal ion binding/oxidoreductase [Pseudozyma hubeiensis SY62]|uniref:Metal ion binding/oxidoreductase n=1 Tax=Pseudozyma hubeiensis (strain SY62) TaxID=1305764 RepID=R9NZE1_PSEHS|nr:metal ion binding/oxidoreductase [Pseudozyma hubeiensis SY62]GAC94223.1 metal ion binding/oxidoreductase [Pseudozyma hubeiensis SY62]
MNAAPGIRLPSRSDLRHPPISFGSLSSSSASASSSTRPRPNLLGSDGFGKVGAQLWAQREDSVVRNRQGSVLNRGLILKTDHFAGGARHAHLNLHLQGAPNFRKADCSLEVYGVAQPTITGLKTILSVLNARPTKHTNGTQGLELRLPPHAAPNGSTSSPNVSSPLSSPSLAQGPAASAETNAGRPSASEKVRRCVWVCTREEPVIYVGGRPFVLREAERPVSTFELSMRADNLEAIESRLKHDILRESSKYGGLVMVHEETASGQIEPTWIAVDEASVHTVREVWDRVKSEGWRVDYHRIPIAEDQALENNYLDAYTQVIKDLDPTETSLVANCGIGFTRTTFAMVAAVILRRKQMLLLGHDDPFAPLSEQQKSPLQTPASGTPHSGVARSLRQASEQQAQNLSLLRLIRVLNVSLSTRDSQSTIEILLSNPALLESLRKANSGDYGIIRQLAGLLDEGLENKAIVDVAIDCCAHVTNLRETILSSRIRYSTDALDEAQAALHLEKAAKSLEKYFFLVAFASYVNASKTATFQHRFANWLKNRAEIWRGIQLIRSKGRRLYFFDPVGDLRILSGGKAGELVATSEKLQSRFGEVSGQGAQVPGDEFADYVIRNRAGIVLRPFTLLKCDIWRKFIERNAGLPIRGTVNFRRIPGSNIFATGQPTVDGIRNVVTALQEHYASKADASSQPTRTVTWINLREEPIVYVNGKPYCLRQKGMSLRNIKAYSGINWDRLLLLEDRLKNDVVNELESGEGRLLLHTETSDGTVIPIWEEASPSDVDTVQDIMTHIGADFKDKVQLRFRRIPMTAEKPPDFSDISELLSAVLQANVEREPIVLNCQLGRGRSTMTAVLILMITRWLQQGQRQLPESRLHEIGDRGEDSKDSDGAVNSSDGLRLSESAQASGSATPDARNTLHADLLDDAVGSEATDSSQLPKRAPLSYHLINSLLRVIPRGLEVKRMVDDCIDQCATVTNLREAIEEARLAAEDTEDEALRKKRIQSAIHNLRRYFLLIVFQSYLTQTRPDLLEASPSFRSFVNRQPVFETIAKEFDKIDISTIMPLQKVDASDGMALSDEVQDVVSHRSGSILSAYTMLKSDFFSGILKLGLPERIEGMPNLRGVSLLLTPPNQTNGPNQPSTPMTPKTPLMTYGRETWGSGMPTVDGLRRGLTRMGAAPNGPAKVVWTSLREEPVLYVNGRPHVLRLADQPITNIEATGVTTDVVEGMELALKNDMLKEAAERGGRVLLHDETEIRQGEFDIIPVWETVKDGDVLTPREVYELVQREGYKVDYARLAITDEQAPVPAVFSQLEERVITALQTGSACVFNCQMGRGRTTTGMVIASLVSTVWHYGDQLVSSYEMSGSMVLPTSTSSDEAVAGAQIVNDAEDEAFGQPKDNLDNREDDLHLQGEWRTILQLVGVLSHGKLAKKLTDRAIDRMEAVQNLRKAIYDSKLRADNAEPGTKKHKHLSTVFTNYLQRYGYLITFANYLLEKSEADGFEPLLPALSIDEGESEMTEARLRKRSESVSSQLSSSTAFTSYADGMGRRFPSFLGWLQPRREIGNILGRDRLE